MASNIQTGKAKMTTFFKPYVYVYVLIKITQPTLQIRFIGKMYRLLAVSDEQIKQE